MRALQHQEPSLTNPSSHQVAFPKRAAGAFGVGKPEVGVAIRKDT